MHRLAIAVFDIDGVVRDVSGSYRRAIADTVEAFTQGAHRPTPEDIDTLKAEGRWNNDWEASQELVYRYFEQKGKGRTAIALSYEDLVDFFQRRYRGPVLEDPSQWTGYISQEPILASRTYFESLTTAQIPWGFFSGATRGSARYILEQRIGLTKPLLVAMDEAPSKPDPTGLYQVAEALAADSPIVPVLYVGDTVADMQTVVNARQQHPERPWIGVGILPPHVKAKGTDYCDRYTQQLLSAGATTVLTTVRELTPAQISALLTDP
jgi:HAD superfamily phosphatase